MRNSANKLVVAVMAVVLAAAAAGCNPSGTDPYATDENIGGMLLNIPTETEVEIGIQVKADVFKQYKKWNNAAWQAKVELMGNRIAGASFADRNDISYEFALLDTDEVNAFAAPGGFIFVTRGLTEFLDNDDQLACVIAHEISHVVGRHSMQQMQTGILLQLAATVVSEKAEDKWVDIAAGVTAVLFSNGYSRTQEGQADRLGLRYAHNAGYRAYGMVEFFHKLQDEYGSTSGLETLLSTHPDTGARIEQATKYIEIHNLKR